MALGSAYISNINRYWFFLAANHNKFLEIGTAIPSKITIIFAQNLTKIFFNKFCTQKLGE